MSTVKDGDTVKVHYTVKLEDGTVFDSSVEGDPLEILVGGDQVLPEFEKALHGMAPGEKKTFKIKSKDAYGERREDLVLEVERSQIPEDLDLEVGQQLQVGMGNGEGTIVTILEVSDETVLLDANHPLAGKDLTFDIELRSIDG